MTVKRKLHEPACMDAHDLINKLSTIIGHCDLLTEMTKTTSEQERRVSSIRNIAVACVKEMKEHQRNAAKIAG
jgi:hypothetical protein